MAKVPPPARTSPTRAAPDDAVEASPEPTAPKPMLRLPGWLEGNAKVKKAREVQGIVDRAAKDLDDAIEAAERGEAPVRVEQLAEDAPLRDTGQAMFFKSPPRTEAQRLKAVADRQAGLEAALRRRK